MKKRSKLPLYRFLPSNCKKRPWPLPHGFRYVQPSEGTLYLHLNNSGRLTPVKGRYTNLLVANINYSYYYITRDCLVPLACNYNTGKLTPDLDATPINLHKPI